MNSIIADTTKAAPQPAACISSNGELVVYSVINIGMFAVGPVK